MSAIAVALIALCGVVLAPLLLNQLNRRNARADREAELQRLKAEKLERYEVAEKAAEAAELLLAAQTRTADAAKEVARVAAQGQNETTMQLKQIHTLVNSDMTAARLAELNQSRVSLHLLKRLAHLDTVAGREPDEADQLAIKETEARIVELEAILADRAAQQKIVERGGG